MTTQQHRSGTTLPTWNHVVTPHIDIIQGELSMDTYAVNLGKVVQGDSSVRLVYRDARSFYEATYLTRELHRILTDVFAGWPVRAVIAYSSCVLHLAAAKRIACSRSITWHVRANS